MALTPIPYTKNWADVFGSQTVPTEANAGSASKVNPPTITNVNVAAGGATTVLATRAGVGKIDWGDGTVEAMAATGNLAHTYTRNGDFGIKIWTDADPSAFATARAHVNNTPKPDTAQVFSVTMTELVGAFTVANGRAPFDVDFGDGTVERHFDQSFSHTYAAAGDYTVKLRDSSSWRTSVIAAAVAPLVAPPEEKTKSSKKAA